MTKKTTVSKKKKRKINKLHIWAVIVSVICIFEICGLIGGGIFAISMLKDKPDFDINDFQNQQSSEIYDAKGNVIAELGMTIRENISYDEMPNVLIDAFVAVEDSRYFEHNGFDMVRFTAALINNIRTLSFSQGGSTFSMQLVKNTYFVDDEAGINAPKKVSRKVQEIALAMELERNTNKKNIFELYVNKLNFGGDRNIRGVEKAAEYYFGKSVKELNLTESALLAGVINAPYRYNPFNFLDNATARRNTVLYQMLNHGYITFDEYQLARCVKVEDLLVSEADRRRSGEGIANQAYIDAVIAEVAELTNLDPYTTPMRIYTYMDPEVQALADQIEAGNVEDFEWPDEDIEIASLSVNNHTGAINAIVGGRNYADGGELLLNHATAQFKQPGSSIKPIIDYAPAFEHLGWATSHVLVDKPIVYSGTSAVIHNSNGRWVGEVTLRDAVGNSLNTPAIQTLEQVIANTSVSEMVAYLNDMGFDQVTTENFNIQFGIGGGELAVSVQQMAGAQAALINAGQYIPPHTIERIEYLNGRAPTVPAYTPKQAISAQDAYLMSDILYTNVYGGYANLMQILRDEYPVYAKTGTTDWGTDGAVYGIPTGSIKDAWMIASTNDYTVATWLGYEKASSDKQSYILMDVYLSNIQGKITNLLTDKNVEMYGVPDKIARPNGITWIEHILGTYPYVAPIEGMDEQYITSGMIKEESAHLVSPEKISVDKIDEAGAKAELKNGENALDYELSLTWPAYPDASKLQVSDGSLDISLYRSDGSVMIEAWGRKLFDYSWVFGPVRYFADIQINQNEPIRITEENTTHTEKVEVKPGDTIETCLYYAYEKNPEVRSENSACSSYTLQDSAVNFTLPGPGMTREQLEQYPTFVNYGIQLNFNEFEVASSSELGAYTFELTYGGNTQKKNAGETIEGIMQSELYNAALTVNFPVLKTQVITLTSDRSGTLNEGETITFTAEGLDGTAYWQIDPTSNISYEQGENNVKITVVAQGEEEISVSVKVTDNNTGLSQRSSFKIAAKAAPEPETPEEPEAPSE